MKVLNDYALEAKKRMAWLALTIHTINTVNACPLTIKEVKVMRESYQSISNTPPS